MGMTGRTLSTSLTLPRLRRHPTAIVGTRAQQDGMAVTGNPAETSKSWQAFASLAC